MKTRNGFVSNSSSSCFLVLYKNLTEEEEKKLSEYGFYQVATDNPFELYFAGRGDYESNGGCALGYDVTCNEDDIAYFLTREVNISFVAAVHYAHWFWKYNKGTKTIKAIKNFGIEEEMYGEDSYAIKFQNDRISYEIQIESLEPPEERDYF